MKRGETREEVYEQESLETLLGLYENGALDPPSPEYVDTIRMRLGEIRREQGYLLPSEIKQLEAILNDPKFQGVW